MTGSGSGFLQTDSARGGTARRPRASAAALAIALLLAERGALADGAPAAFDADLTALPFEQLLNMEVYSASRFMQKSIQAPSAVTVIGAAEIRDFGWRTLADVMRSVRGLYVSYDRNYSYLGARGFLRPGDYNTRFLLQIDGKRINDPVYDQAPVGGEFPLDLELIERIEFVPGPGSSIYGANAFFGVINVITKRPQEMSGARARVEGGQFGARKGAASYAGSDGQGNEWLLAASRYKTDGRDQHYAEFDTPAQNHGVARRLDYESGQRLFVKGGAGPFSLSLLRDERDKGVPTASFGQAFDDPRSHTLDAHTYLDLGYRAALASGTELSSRLYWGSYDSSGDYVNDVPGLSVDHDGSRGRWWGMDVNTVSTPAPGHKLVAGAEYQRDYRMTQFSYNVAPYQLYLDQSHDSRRFGLYLQDEFALRDDLLLNAGLRYDHHERSGGALSPRLALIHQAGPATTLKALYGTAYREPNIYELYYAFPGPDGQRASPLLGRERIRSAELVLVRQLSDSGRLTVTAFRNVVSGLISQGSDPDSGISYFYNAGDAVAHGAEAEYERHWPNQTTLRASYGWQKLRLNDDGVGAVNAPATLLKLNLAAPLGRSAWRAGLEAQYVGPRDTLLARTGGFWIANLNFNAARLTRQLSVSAGLYNLFGRRYADPAPASHVQDSIAQDGRSARATLNYAF